MEGGDSRRRRAVGSSSEGQQVPIPCAEKPRGKKERTRSYAIILIKMVAREVEEGGRSYPAKASRLLPPPYLRKAVQGRAVLWHMGRFTARGT
jgi:hypothetical protein